MSGELLGYRKESEGRQKILETGQGGLLRKEQDS